MKGHIGLSQNSVNMMCENYVVYGSFFNIACLFVSIAGLIKFKFEPHITTYFIISLILGTIQSLVNWKIHKILKYCYNIYEQTEYFGKKEFTNLQVFWVVLYLAMIIYTVCTTNNFNDDISGIEEIYLDVIIASNCSRFIISILNVIVHRNSN